MNGRTDGQTDGLIPIYTQQNFVGRGGDNKIIITNQVRPNNQIK